jgi:hypothetical protein
MKTRRIAAAVLFALSSATVTSLPGRALADDDATTVQARARFKEGVEAYDKGKYEEARLLFYQAYMLKRHPSLLLNLAQSSAKANKPLDAAKYFQQFLKEATTANAQQRKDAESGLAEVRQKLGRIEVIAPSGTEVSLDDQGKVGTTPMDPIDVEPGQHTVKSPGQTVSVTAAAGKSVKADLGKSSEAAPAPIPAPVPAPSPSDTSPNPPAQNTVQAETSTEKPGLFSRPASMAPVYIGLTAAGIGGAGAIIFALFKSDAQSKSDTVTAQIRNAAAARNLPAQGVCNRGVADLANACQTLKDNNSKVDTDATIANISLGVMGVGLAVAVGWYLFAPKRGDEKPTQGHAPVVTPYAGYGTGGLVLSGEL